MILRLSEERRRRWAGGQSLNPLGRRERGSGKITPVASYTPIFHNFKFDAFDKLDGALTAPTRVLDNAPWPLS